MNSKIVVFPPSSIYNSQRDSGQLPGLDSRRKKEGEGKKNERERKEAVVACVDLSVHRARCVSELGTSKVIPLNDQFVEYPCARLRLYLERISKRAAITTTDFPAILIAQSPLRSSTIDQIVQAIDLDRSFPPFYLCYVRFELWNLETLPSFH